ncbi:MAG TPA: hypothetical protein VLI05_07035 [Candidatus Saccharimonadia bacterium]|nr:hypothetical protein [Candidatus Saccharimonadia bacterium]
MAQRRGTSVLIAVVIITFGGGLAASAYLNYYQYQRDSQNQQLLQGQITDLRYQLKQETNGSPAPSISPSPSLSPSPSASPSPVLGAQTVNLAELGVKLTPTDPVADLTYGSQTIAGLGVANLTTSSLLAKYPACKPGALGMVVRRPLGSRPSTSASHLIKKIGDYNFYYVTPSGNCGPDSAGRATVSAAIAAVQNLVMPTLTN